MGFLEQQARERRQRELEENQRHEAFGEIQVIIYRRQIKIVCIHLYVYYYVRVDATVQLRI